MKPADPRPPLTKGGGRVTSSEVGIVRPDAEPECLMRSREVRDLLGCTGADLWHLECRRDLIPLRFWSGKGLRWYRADVEAFALVLEARREANRQRAGKLSTAAA